jgi:hypothetical protein
MLSRHIVLVFACFVVHMILFTTSTTSSQKLRMPLNDIGGLVCQTNSEDHILYLDVYMLSIYNDTIELSGNDINIGWGAAVKTSNLCDRNNHLLRSISYDIGAETCEGLLFEFIANCIAGQDSINEIQFHTAGALLLHGFEEQKMALSLAFHVPKVAQFIDHAPHDTLSDDGAVVAANHNSEELGQDSYPCPRILKRSLISLPRLAVAYIVYFPFDLHCSVLTMLMQLYSPPAGMDYDRSKSYLQVRKEWQRFVDSVTGQVDELMDVFVFIGTDCAAGDGESSCEYATQCKADLYTFMTFFELAHSPPSLLNSAASLLLSGSHLVSVQDFSSRPPAQHLASPQPHHRQLDAYLELLGVARSARNGQAGFFVLFTATTRYTIPPGEVLHTFASMQVLTGGAGIYSSATTPCSLSAQEAGGDLHGTCSDVFLGVSRWHLEMHGDLLLPPSFLQGLFEEPSQVVTSYPLAMILFALLDVYRPWQNYLMFATGSRQVSSIDTPLPFSHLDREFFAFYAGHVTAARLNIAPAVSELFFKHGKRLSWTPSSLAYGGEGLFYTRYCHKSTGCATDGLSEQSATMSFVLDTWLPRSAQFTPKRETPGARVVFVTAIIGNYESAYPFVAPQTVATDYFCFRGGESVDNSDQNWIVDNYAYHLDPFYQAAAGDAGDQWNSYANNQHSFMVAKFYKMNFRLIPRLQKYDVVIWIDGSLSLTDVRIAETALELTQQRSEKLIMFESTRSTLQREAVLSSIVPRYAVSEWAGQQQPYQDVLGLYESYVKRGYTEAYWRQVAPDRPLYGMWVTCFVVFNMKSADVHMLLREWYQQTLMNTQDQMTLSFVVQALRVLPYSLPDGRYVNGTVRANTWYRKKASHG